MGTQGTGCKRPSGVGGVVPFHTVLFGRKSLCAAHTFDIGNDSAPPSQWNLCLLLEISLQGKFFSYPLSIHSLNRQGKFIYISRDSWIFVLSLRS